jgi:hypothetical protein
VNERLDRFVADPDIAEDIPVAVTLVTGTAVSYEQIQSASANASDKKSGSAKAQK